MAWTHPGREVPLFHPQKYSDQCCIFILPDPSIDSSIDPSIHRWIDSSINSSISPSIRTSVFELRTHANVASYHFTQPPLETNPSPLATPQSAHDITNDRVPAAQSQTCRLFLRGVHITTLHNKHSTLELKAPSPRRAASPGASYRPQTGPWLHNPQA